MHLRFSRPLVFCLMLILLFYSALSVSSETAISSENLPAKIDTIVQKYHDFRQFDGIVLVAQKGKILYKKAFGIADREWNIPITVSTKFKIASITKQFTALLVMQLVERGTLKLEGTIADYLPDYRKDTGSKITLKHLLTHTSGLPNLDENAGFYQSHDSQLSSPIYVVKSFCSGDLISEPGLKFNYNNADYIILGAILEKVTGKPYKQLLQTEILQPLNMFSSGLVNEETVLGNLARGYTYNNGIYTNEPYFRIQNFYAAGAMYATIDDLYLWDRALDINRLLSKSATMVMFTPSQELGYVALGSWAYTLKMSGGAKPLFVERQGSIGAFHSLNLRAPEQEIALILLSNLDNSDLFTIYAKKGLPYELLQAIFEPRTDEPK
ncbi:serine hydrolase domain-containing protein [Anthocerotibacter panamensis]|uniref:serine hydrolase domain-containing protein n=1 Tax=Anthocerotibacter panamensis TaxID=2857077 RepID=UPI001C402AB7|nr:serine hydrolase domain-containing protein [Anthocerotibacter panamensis]